MDPLDRLTRHLIQSLERQGGRLPESEGAEAALDAGGCPGDAVLRQLAEDRLPPPAGAHVREHLDRCLGCLNRFVDVRDCLHGVTAPGPPTARLEGILDTLLGRERWTRPPAGAGTVKRLVEARIPAWTAAVAAAALVLVTWTAAHKSERADGPATWPPVIGGADVDRLEPAYGSVSRTLAGTVGSIRDVTSQGVDAHVVGIQDVAGTTYLLFTWGRPTVQLGDTVEVDAIITDASRVAGLAVYQGIATDVRHTR